MSKERQLTKTHLRGKSPSNESIMVSFYDDEIEITHLDIAVVDGKGTQVGTIMLGRAESVTIPFSQLTFRPSSE